MSSSNPSAGGVVESTLREMGVQSYWEKVAPLVTEYGVRVAGALLFLLVALYVAGFAARAARQALERSHIEVTLARFLSSMVRVVVLALAVLTCMSIVGIPVTSFAALLGAGGLATGLALQGSLSNIAAGAALSITRPFKVDDFVVIAGQTGIVKDIGLFATSLDTPDNRRIIIPNGQIFGAIIENMTYNTVRRVEVDVGTAYDADLAIVRAALEGAARAVESRVDDPPPLVMTTAFADSAVQWKVCVWAPKERFLECRQQMYHAIKRSLDESGVDIPFPQRVVRVTSARQAGGSPDRGATPSPRMHGGGVRDLQDDLLSGEADAPEA